MLAISAGAGFWFVFVYESNPRPVSETEAGVKRVATVRDGDTAIYDGDSWESRFWTGINLGATTPGHFPGELSPSKEDYLRWFPKMKEMNIDMLRVYTILPPHFYEALEEFNSGRDDPLWLTQGIWSPEEELIGEDKTGRDAYEDDISKAFDAEIQDAVGAVNGDVEIAPEYGKASGKYTTDVSPYILGWILDTEWHPYAVQTTDEAHAGDPLYTGKYFTTTQEASPFESWLASKLDLLAKEEMKYGWQHPVSFTNWLTADPLEHPNEPFEKEDLVTVDPMHLEPTEEWTAGYFAAYHAYPYYPDFLRYDTKYQDYRNADGEIDPYAGYLDELQSHHKNLPLIIAEFGVPSPRGLAHRGPLGRDQGMHSEKEQGRMDAAMLSNMRQEGLDGGILFAWQDEWFKYTWDTLDLELPDKRRDLWRNRLTNEEHFGVLAVEPGESAEDMIQLDGDLSDFENAEDSEQESYPDFDLTVSHDEASLYLLFDKKQGDWNFSEDELDVRFGSLPDGSDTAAPVPGASFEDGIQFLLRMRGEDQTRLLVDSAYDQHTWLYTERLDMLPDKNGGAKERRVGDFLPWKLAVSRELKLPQTGETIPFEEFNAGFMRSGITDPESPDFDNLADWYADGDILEVRIPWMLLGYTDPSSRKVWDYPYEADELKPVPAGPLRVHPVLRAVDETVDGKVPALSYSWDGWDEATYHEREKKSFGILRKAFAEKKLVKP